MDQGELLTGHDTEVGSVWRRNHFVLHSKDSVVQVAVARGLLEEDGGARQCVAAVINTRGFHDSRR